MTTWLHVIFARENAPGPPPIQTDFQLTFFRVGPITTVYLIGGRSWYDDCSEPCTMGTIMPLRTKIAATVVAHVPLLWLVEGYPIASTGNLVRLVDNAPWELKMNWDVQDKFLFANLVRRCQTWQMCLRGITIVCLYYQLRLLVWQPENKLQQ